MSHFTNDFLKFFRGLEKNNNRDWFQDNKKLYESAVKEPFKLFVEDMIKRMQKIDPDIKMEAKQAIFRINRDIRFSKDKSPYKIHMSAAISAGGKKDYTTPGMYIQMNHKDARIYSGTHDLDKDSLQAVREYIVNNMAEFKRLTTAKGFTSVYGEVHGDKHKRLAKEFQEAAEKQPLLYNKSFYYYTKWDPKAIMEKDFPAQVIKAYKAAGKLNDFFNRALGNA